MQAKKLDDIRAEAHAELGMVAPVSGLESLPGLGPLPALPALAGRDDDIDLFPAFRGDGGWLWPRAGARGVGVGCFSVWART